MFLLKKSFIFGYIYILIFFQIILESFPISSSGHLKLIKILNEKFNFFDFLPLKYFGLNFEFLHLPTIFIILIFFRKRFKILLINCYESMDFFWRVALFVFAADFITAIFYLLKKIIKLNIPLYLGFALTCFILLSLSFCDKYKKLNTVGFWDARNAILLGLLQGTALIPGISRFAIVFVGSRHIGYSSKDALFVTFLIEVPLLFAGICKGVLSSYLSGGLSNVFNIDASIVFVFILSSVFSYLCLLFVKKIIEKNKLWMISFYMLIPTLISLLMGV